MKNPIVHFEIPVDNVERAQKFYTEIFDWKITEVEMPATGSTGGDPYYMVYAADTDKDNMVTQTGAINGGMMKRKQPGQPFMNYIQVDEINNVLEKIKEHGGEIYMPKTEIAEGMGWIACFKDSEGNMMGLHQMGKKNA